MSQTSPQTPQRPQGMGVLLSLFGLLLAVIAGSVVWVMINSDTGNPRPWSKPAINGTEITVQYQAACVDGKNLKVDETAASVTLTLTVKETEKCSEPATTHTETAVLKGSFNDRQLSDGACTLPEFNGTEACSVESHAVISNTGLKNKVADPTDEPSAQPSTEPSAS